MARLLGMSYQVSPMRRRVLIVGGGAREHALGASFSDAELFFAPGNAGTAALGTNVPLRAGDPLGIAAWARENRVDLVVVGPEAPLAMGIIDHLSLHGISAFGPSARAALLEASKSFTKRLAKRAGVPTADAEVFDDANAAVEYVRAASRPLVIKADGLAGGKGTILASGAQEAVAAIQALMIERVVGDAGKCVLVEETLAGEEISFHVIVDGDTLHPLPIARDYKRLRDGDLGPNTGGMGAVAPIDMGEPLSGRILEKIIAPTLRELQREGIVFRGVLYAGLMISRGEPSLLEFNVRFGDPEASVIVPRLSGDLFELLRSPSSIRDVRARSSGASLAVVLATSGYPSAAETGAAISGMGDVANSISVHHANTEVADGALVTSGGRALVVVANEDTVALARESALAAAHTIQFLGKHYRTDIGKELELGTEKRS